MKLRAIVSQEQVNANLAWFHSLGFDKSYEGENQSCWIRCSQCAAVIVNGVPIHEGGCPNETHECAECNERVKRGVRLCESCANPEPDGPADRGMFGDY